MRTIKRIFGLILTIALILSFPVAVSAGGSEIDGGKCGDNLTWTVEDTGQFWISGTGPMYNYTAGTTPWYQYADMITTIDMEEGITAIGNYAFYNFTALDRWYPLTIPASVEYVGSYALSVHAPYDDSVGYYEYEIVFLGDAPAFGERAFHFTGCEALYPGNNDTWTFDIMQLYGGDVNWIYNGTSGKCGDNLTWELTDKTITISGTGSMYDYGLEPLATEEQIAENGWAWAIQRYAPWYSLQWDFTEVVIEEGVTSIGQAAFEECRTLQNISISDTVTAIGEYAFNGCQDLESILIPKGVTEIAPTAFGKWTETIEVAPENPAFSVFEGNLYNKDQTGLLVFANWNMDELIVPEGVEFIGQNAFVISSRVDLISLPKTLVSFDVEDIYMLEPEAISVSPENPKYCSIENNLYSKDGTELLLWVTDMEDIVIPEGVTIIKKQAVRYIYDAKTITFASTVATFEEEAVWCCNVDAMTFLGNNIVFEDYAIGNCEIGTITFLGDAPTFAQNSFWATTADVQIPKDNDTWTAFKMRDYRGSLNWLQSDLEDITWELSNDGVLTVRGTAWMELADASEWNRNEIAEILSVVIEDGVPNIGDGAFQWRKNLENIAIPDSVQEIGDSAFIECTKIEDITIPSKVKYIGDCAFAFWNQQTITFTGDAPEFNAYAFLGAKVTVCYPQCKASWTKEVRQDYGGDVTWEMIPHPYENGVCSLCGAKKPSYTPGDIDDNAAVNILDVMAIINIITGSMMPSDTQSMASDVNGDGSINILDAMALINQITGA